MFLRLNSSTHYKLAGWSFRLFAADQGPTGFANKGAAFNSCFAMSYVPGVDTIIMMSKGHAFGFRLGHVNQDL
jgi:hypothetical protein